MLKVGLSEVDLTPPVGTSLVGYFEDRKSTGIHDRLVAQTILLESKSTRVAMMTTDLIALLPETVQAAKELIVNSVPVPPENVFIHTTHTHTGPATVSAFGVEKDEEYLGYLPKLLAGSAREAFHNLQPASVGFGCGSEGDVSFNRRYLMKDGTVRTNPGVGDKWDAAQGKGNPDIVRPTGPIDPEVGVMRIDSESGEPLALLINYACHDDTVGGELMSADYPGVIRDVVRRVCGPRVMPCFFNGACGNLNHVNFQALNLKQGYFAHTRWMGTIIGAEVVRVAEKIETQPVTALSTASTILDIPIRKPSEEELTFARHLVELGPEGLNDAEQEELERRTNRFGNERLWAREAVLMAKVAKETETVPVGVVRVGDAGLAFLPGEAFVEFGLKIKSESPFKPTFVVELTNSGLGYIPTQQAFAEGTGYEERFARSSFLAPEAGDLLSDEALGLLASL